MVIRKIKRSERFRKVDMGERREISDLKVAIQTIKKMKMNFGNVFIWAWDLDSWWVFGEFVTF